MEGISQITDSIRLPVEIPVYAHFFDHHIEGKAVLPAVEAMQVLARTVKSFRPGTRVTYMTQGRFEKFLYLQAGNSGIDAFVDVEMHANGDVRAFLLTKTRSGKSAITRSKIHAAVCFPQKQTGPEAPPVNLQAFPEGIRVEVSPADIYRDLVPFGPSYQNITAPLYISANGAIAEIASPAGLERPQDSGSLGSPFCLDAAFHAACVWAQCYRHTVAFPVGFSLRRVYHPTRAALVYSARITPVAANTDRLVFDIWISDPDGRVCESIRGVQMRDVSAGRVMPPSWIKRAGSGIQCADRD